jgi:TonB family protein
VRWVWAIGLAVAGHLAFLACLVLVSLVPHPPAPPQPQAVALRTIDSQQWERNRGRARPFQLPAPQRAPVTPESIPVGQIVDVAPGNDEVDPSAKYLAETNNRVKKHTHAQVQTSNYGRAAPKTLAATEARALAEQKTGGKSASAISAVGQVERFLGTGGFRPTVAQAAVPQVPGSGENESPLATGSEHGEDAQTRSGADVPTSETGGGAPNDNLNDVEAGDGTFLNTREWKYAGFFNRMKQAIGAKWDPQGRARSKDPSGRRVGIYDRVTVVTIILNTEGGLQEVYVAKRSGVDFLDDEAVQAVQRAAPFPNPPPSLARNGLIRFDFGFTLTNEGLGMQRLFRYPR